MDLLIQDYIDVGSIGAVLVMLVGGYFLARGFWISDKEIEGIGSSKVVGDTLEENLTKIPAMQDRLKFRKDAKIGFTLMVIGASLQIIFIVLDRFLT